MAGALPGPDWLRRRRLGALERFQAAGLPSESEEIWRYSRIDNLDLDRFAPATPRGADGPSGVPSGAADSHLGEVMEALGDRSALVLVGPDGSVEADVARTVASQGVTVGLLSEHPEGAELLGAIAGGAGAKGADVFVDLATAFASDAVVVDVPAGVSLEAPVLVGHWYAGAAVAHFPRTVVRLGPGARASVVEHLSSSQDDVLCCPVVELDVGDGAALDYTSIQRLGSRAWQLGYQGSRVGRDASLRSLAAALGGYYARLRTDSHLVAAGGSAQLMALYFGDHQQMHDFRTLQEHAAPKTTSDLLFKGAARDEARGVYSGLIRVRKGAAGTNAFQTNRNLVLSEGAHAESVPNLEIEENDVRCSHASAVGPVDEDQRYYLESRGIPPEVADRLIVLGFFDDLLARSPVPALRQPLRRVVAEKASAPAPSGGNDR
ncbi:MAG TPA: Fe-S cluster assembly protein SufD [Acidimicrobiales bacterium]|nr:Fe-S cluster assembly protein SufD [Acidimicrobiales bacterium]